MPIFTDSKDDDILPNSIILPNKLLKLTFIIERAITFSHNTNYYVLIIRFFIEAFRTDSLYVFGLKTAQLVSIVFVIVGLIGFIYCHFKGQDVLEER